MVAKQNMGKLWKNSLLLGEDLLLSYMIKFELMREYHCFKNIIPCRVGYFESLCRS